MKSKKEFYLATSYENRKFAGDLVIQLCERDFFRNKYVPAFPWWCIEPEAEEAQIIQESLARNEFAAVQRSSLVIILEPGRKGTWSEFGISVSNLTRETVFCMPQSCKDNKDLPPFIYLDQVRIILIPDEIYTNTFELAAFLSNKLSLLYPS